MLINQIATFLSNKSVLYLFSVIDNSRFNFGGKFKFIDFREKPTFTWKSFWYLWCNWYFSMACMSIKLAQCKSKTHFVWLFTHAYGMASFLMNVFSTIDISRNSRISREKLKLILAFSREMKNARNWPP